MNFEQKYLQYKFKYLNLKNQVGGEPKFPNAGVSGSRVIIDRSRIAKVISSKLVSGIYEYTVEYVDVDPRVKIEHVKESRIISFPKNKINLNDANNILQPKTEIYFRNGGSKKKGRIIGIVENDNETYEVYDPTNIVFYDGIKFIQIERANITFSL